MQESLKKIMTGQMNQMTDPATGYRFRYEQQLKEQAYFSSEERSPTKGTRLNLTKT